MHPIRALHARVRELPVLTHIDVSRGTRIELSAATLLNNISKTAHLLSDEAQVEPGDAVLIDIPAHWQSATWICAAWSIGAKPIFAGTAKAAITTIDRTVIADEVFVTGLHPFGLPLAAPVPHGAIDWSVAMRTFPDSYSPSHLQEVSLDHDQRIARDARVALITNEASKLATVLADVLSHDATLILITGAKDANVDSILTQEQTQVII